MQKRKGKGGEREETSPLPPLRTNNRENEEEGEGKNSQGRGGGEKQALWQSLGYLEIYSSILNVEYLERNESAPL